MQIGLITPPDTVVGNDVLTAIAVLGQHTLRITLGTGVAPTYPRHPLVMAQQALTVQAACNGRLQLGLGLSHQGVIEDLMGLSYKNPVQHMREYLAVVGPLINGEGVSHQGENYRVQGSMNVPGATPCPILVAALGPRMLKLAGELSAGTVTWMVGIETIKNHIVPKITDAAAAVGKVPRVVASLPVVVTDSVEQIRSQIDSSLKMYGQLPSYRRMLDREGVSTPSGVSLLGTEAEVGDQLDAFASAGVTEFVASIPELGQGDYARTYDFLKARATTR